MLDRPKYASNSQPFTVLVEGNIGSGKTTFVNHFEQFSDRFFVVSEPVEMWRNFNGANLLELFYKGPERWAMPFQSYVTLTMLQNHLLPTDKPVKMMERSLFSSMFCFVENMRKTNRIDPAMYHILRDWFHFIDTTMHIRADLILYLRTSPEVVHERMRRRARSEESCVSLEYLTQLHALHEEWLVEKRAHGIEVITLDADVGLDQISEQYQQFYDTVVNKLHE